MSESKAGFDLYRGAITLLLVVSLFAVLSWLQGRFDTSDHEKATKLVRTYRPREPFEARSIEEVILAKHPGKTHDDLKWSSRITSGCLGYVRVTGTVDNTSYAFDVDLNGPSVHPTDPTTVAILKSLTSTSAAP